jgi:hypothetical protein
MLLAGERQHHPDALYPARMQLARFRRSGQPADILVVQVSPSGSLAGRRQVRECASAVSSVLRVTDGVSMVPSLGGSGWCAVLESDEHARTAIDRRLRSACGSAVRLAWATSPDDGATLEALLEVGLNRLPPRESGRPERGHGLRQLPLPRLLPRSLGPERGPMRSHH